LQYIFLAAVFESGDWVSITFDADDVESEVVGDGAVEVTLPGPI
jgi:hypothetical protein